MMKGTLRGPSRNPLQGNPLQTRGDVQQAVLDLFEPLVPAFERGGARVSLGTAAARFDRAAQDLEGFARPLWGIVPFAAGGGAFPHWARILEGLTNGTDPTHAEYWGPARDHDQRLVEMGAIGFALALAPDRVWTPLSEAARRRLVAWLGAANDVELHRNNWQFFRILVNLGLRRIGVEVSRARQEESFAEIERHYAGEGWYRDGRGNAAFDYYNAWAYHYYGLIYAALAGPDDPERSTRFRERARRFAADFQHWFDPEGRAVPLGRSLTYRFAAGAFWGALALAGEEAAPWGLIKGLYLRHLRAWASLPIGRADGVLSLGFAFENPFLAENYSSPASPYWAMKYFLALAVPGSHPFWQAAEEPLPPLDAPHPQPVPGFVVSRDATQAQLLSGARGRTLVRQAAAKYGRFAYSSVFGFSLDDPWSGSVSDSGLTLVDPGGTRAVRGVSEECRIEGGRVHSRWRPWPDVVVETLLVGRAPWHWRRHRVRTARPLQVLETGFAVGWEGGAPDEPPAERSETQGSASVRVERGLSAVFDLDGRRQGRVLALEPNSNVISPRALMPVLEARLGPGEHALRCAVVATDRPASLCDMPPPPDAAWDC